MFRTAVVCLFAILSTGCASIVSGHNQSVSVKTRSQGTELAGATCKLANDKGEWYATTPGSVTVRRSYADLAVNCTHASVNTGLASAKSTTKGMAFGNLIFGGIIGVGVDVASGAAYDYPDVINVSMGLPIVAMATVTPADATAQLKPPLESVPATIAPSPPPPIALQTVPPVPVPAAVSLPISVVVPAVAAPLPVATRVAAIRPAVASVEAQARGEYVSSAERLSRAFSCYATPKLVSKGADAETYSLTCAPGDTLIVRCDSNSCREMK